MMNWCKHYMQNVCRESLRVWAAVFFLSSTDLASLTNIDVPLFHSFTPSVVFSGSTERLKTNDDPLEVLKNQLQEFTTLLTEGSEGGRQTSRRGKKGRSISHTDTPFLLFWTRSCHVIQNCSRLSIWFWFLEKCLSFTILLKWCQTVVKDF